MRRLYLLFSDVQLCRVVVSELEAAGIPKEKIHVLASLTRRLEGLPEATVWQKTELAHGIWIGAAIGAVAGLSAGLLGIFFPPPGLALGWGAVLGSSIAGIGFGSLVSALMKGHEHNHRLDRYHSDIEAGKILMMVDVSRARGYEVRGMILKHHADAEIHIEDSNR
ncbi:MAG: DUF1269 domain-containing protein [Gammaproteobacteria bacterium]|nr:DUF1269 domain-containing protein [Gammaproteobacteria bacterium]